MVSSGQACSPWCSTIVGPHGTGSEVAVLSASIGGVDWATTAFAAKDGKLRFINWQALTGAP